MRYIGVLIYLVNHPFYPIRFNPFPVARCFNLHRLAHQHMNSAIEDTGIELPTLSLAYGDIICF